MKRPPRSPRSFLAWLGLALVAAALASGVRAVRLAFREPAAPAPSLPPPDPWTTWSHQPSVSILVAAWNEGTNIDDLVASFQRLTYPHRQLVLSAGGGDGSYARARGYAGPEIVVHEQHAGQGKQRALQAALPSATGEVILLTDADCVLTDASFLRLMAPIANEDAAVVTGASEPKPAQRGNPLVRYQWFTDAAWYRQRPATVDGILGRNTALRREVLAAIGGFDPPVRTGTDYVMGRLLTMARYEIRSVPASRVQTEYPATAGAYLRMWRRWNKNLLIHGPEFGAWDDVRGVAQGFAFAAAVLSPPLVAAPLGPVALLAPTALFLKAVVARVPRLKGGADEVGEAVSWRLLARLPFYTFLDLLGVVLAVADAIRPGTRGRW